MHIIHTVSSNEILSSGVTYCVNELAYGLHKAGDKVEILSLGSGTFSMNDDKFDYKFKKDFSYVPFINKVGVSSTMKKYITSSSSDILHTHGLWMFPNIYRNSNAKFVISPHGMLGEAALKFSAKQKRIFDYLFQRSAFRDAKLLFATAESEFEDIRNYGLKMPVAIIPNGVKIPNIRKNNADKNKKTLVSLGRLHPIKGLFTLIKAWSSIESKFNNWELKIVGPDQVGHKKELQVLIKRLNLKKVFIEPPLYGLDKDLFLSRCDLFILPSKSENFGLTVAESLAVEVPVIATKNTPWSGLNKYKCGFWIEGGEISLAETLEQALKLTNKELNDMGKRGKKWMKKDFSWECSCKKTKEAYNWLTKLGKKPDFIYT